MPVLVEDDEIRRLLSEATTIAVVGLSPNPTRDSHRIALFLQRAGCRIVPVNPAVTTLLGERSWPDLDRVPERIDIVDIFRRPEHVPAIVEAAIRKGVRAVWMQPGTAEDAAALRASEAGLEVVVDRCILVEHRHLLRGRGTPGTPR